MADILTYKKQSSLYGFIFTLFIAGGILAILILIILRTPIPPYPEGGGGTGNGIEINLGFSDVGAGDQPTEDISSEEAVAPKEDVVEQKEEKVITQDEEEAPVIKESIKKEKKEVKKAVTPKPIIEKKPEQTKPKQVVNKNALYQRGKQTSSDGTSKTQGDQGVPNGNPFTYGKGGSGGSGGGSGGGNGTGIGPNNGNGISFKLKDRNPLRLPAPEYKSNESGIVVVEVTVDKDGKVTQANAGVKGTSTPDEELINAAQKAALKAQFDRKPDAPAYQKGTITYIFRLQ